MFSGILQPKSPLTALAQRYGFSPYSLFTTLAHCRVTPESYNLHFALNRSNEKLKKSKEKVRLAIISSADYDVSLKMLKFSSTGLTTTYITTTHV